MTAHFASMDPKLRRWLITICTMTATVMQALDTTIANVALPYMQGSLSASLDQINWVLTSYIVAAAIMTAPIGWLSDRFGRKKLFVICVAGFTFASFLCDWHKISSKWWCSGCCRGWLAPRLFRCPNPYCWTPIPPKSAAKPWRSGGSA
jgi:Na+/melibiose symporter-like transporter